MTIINTDTNATLNGWSIPVGAYDLDVEGAFAVVTSGGVTTNLVVGSGDTLIVNAGAVGFEPGVSVWAFLALGFGLVFTMAFGIGFAKRVKSGLGGGRIEV